jgi:hypothetical protein
MISKKKERKLLMDILKTPMKLPKSNAEIVLSPKSYSHNCLKILAQEQISK